MTKRMGDAAGAARARLAEIELPKPRLRGVIHQHAFFVAVALGIVLVALAPNGRAVWAFAIYGAALSALFGASALHHRGRWSGTVGPWIRRLDHSMIFVFIAGTYSVFGLLVFEGTFATVVLIVVWSGAAAGILFSMFWIDAPTWLAALLYVALGWVAVATFPALAEGLGAGGMSLVVIGGVLYTVGAVVYARRRPDPSPAVFGYHEIFHVLVTCAALLHFLAIALFVLPVA